jgi:hypothetical protein
LAPGIAGDIAPPVDKGVSYRLGLPVESLFVEKGLALDRHIRKLSVDIEEKAASQSFA